MSSRVAEDSNMHITQVTPKDLPDLIVMIRKLCAFHGDACHIGLADAQQRFIDGPLIALIARSIAGDPLGYAVMERHWRPMNTADGFDIAHLFVEEARRSQGIGRALIEAARAQAIALNASRLTIGTSPLNPAAAAAYRSMGLSEVTGRTGARFQVDLGASASGGS